MTQDARSEARTQAASTCEHVGAIEDASSRRGAPGRQPGSSSGQAPSSRAVDTSAAARAWVDAWSRAWPAADPGPLAAVYAEDAVFRSHPFREEHEGREGVLAYARWAFADQEGFRTCSFGEPAVSGDRATVEYWAVIVEQGREVTIAGVALLRFGPDGLVRSQRDYWAVEPGARTPPDGWGR